MTKNMSSQAISFPNTGGITVSSGTLPAVFRGIVSFRIEGSEILVIQLTVESIPCLLEDGNLFGAEEKYPGGYGTLSGQS